MKHFCIFLLYFLCIIAKAQTTYDPIYDGPYGKKIADLAKEILLEKPQMEYIYYYICSDPIIDKSKEEYRILQVGKRYTLFKDYNR